MKFVFHFGDAFENELDLANKFSNFRFYSLKQTHSDKVVLASKEKVDADAHWTTDLNLALCVRTADCMPVLLYSPEILDAGVVKVSAMVAAIHAGWRGVEQNIVGKMLATLIDAGANPDKILAWIGPHISQQSFEVGLDIAARLNAAYEIANASAGAQAVPVAKIILPHKDTGKKYVDLEKIVSTQLLAAGVSRAKITCLARDTFSSTNYHSFRRDRDRAGRQISFIALIP